MTKREENKLSMYKGVREVLTTHSDAYSSVPVIGEILSGFSDVIDEIEQVDFDFRGATKGATADKIHKQEELIDKTITLAKVLFVYAVKAGDNALKEEFRLNRSDIGNMRDTDLQNKAIQVISSAENYLAELANYGVTEATITSARTVYDDYVSAFDTQAEVMAERSSERVKLTGLFDRADEILYEELDPMIELLAESESSFYNEYQSARVIKDLG